MFLKEQIIMHRNSSEKCIFGETVLLSYYLAAKRL